ncbi:endonuclease III [Caloranaerobacter azorensis]|uniref:Endonuclease III n=3 Tax=Caloranaerobacter azorensis TaxID=116090 RepID=A0A1M5UAK2_9FIRM|nr:endonuclease III [Caloranaerobacter azorensis]KGG80335.1 endonuclease III [Caloranaerobacter azorensis H53214]QIB25988.1 endonuclease III [Caloranaerobacter azorensis]SHH60024.1 DNA-(apurinic or apyrimidinic site) lyase /endonuclease III [Caloranaerobacter azorensis DSM 13643]
MKKRLTKKEIKEVLKILQELYPNAKSELNYSNAFELLIATILAAQCTDKRVNQVTDELFKKYKSPKDYIKLSEEELGDMIKSCGFYRNKSKNILKTCEILIKEYNGEVPDSREELMKLPGVGRKTANVVLSNAFGKDAIAVDTHVFRVSNRIGLASSDNVYDTERDLMRNIPPRLWSDAHHWLIYHGRRVCKARKPKCEICPLTQYCLYYKKIN